MIHVTHFEKKLLGNVSLQSDCHLMQQPIWRIVTIIKKNYYTESISAVDFCVRPYVNFLVRV